MSRPVRLFRLPASDDPIQVGDKRPFPAACPPRALGVICASVCLAIIALFVLVAVRVS